MIKNLFRLIFKFIWVVWLLILILIGARFAQKNSESISLDLIFAQAPEASVGFIVCLAFACGAVFGVIVLGPLLFFKSRKVKKLTIKNQKLSKPSNAALLPNSK